jgi:hypothetical protein
MKKSHAILRALEEAAAPQTPEELAAAIDSPDDGKLVGQLLCALRKRGHAEDVDKRGAFKLWSITDAGRQFLTDAGGEQQDDATAPPPSRRVIAAGRQWREADSAHHGRATKKKSAGANSHHSAAPPTTGPAPAVGWGIAVRDDGALVVLEGDRCVYTFTPELALRVADLVRRLHADGREQ